MPRSGAYVLTVIVRATYEIAPGTCRLTDQQEEPNEYDNYWNDDDTRSLYAPSDLVPFKPRADVVLVGHAFAPPQSPARSIATRLAVAGADKTIEVWCERLLTPDGVVREGSPFTKIPLRYERAAASLDNPVGIWAEPRADKGGAIVLPNLQQPGVRVEGHGGVIATVGYGPIAPSWQARSSKLPQPKAGLPPGWHHQPVPEGLDPSFFNVAPPDQQVERLAADQSIILENLHPQHAKVVTELPGVAPKVVAERGGRAEELMMSADTLWFDTDRALCTLTWRGQLRLERPDAQGRVSITMTKVASEQSAPRREGPMPVNVSAFLQQGIAAEQALSTMEIGEQDAEDPFGEETLKPSGARVFASTLPFVQKSSVEGDGGVPAWLPPVQESGSPDADSGNTVLVDANAVQEALPFLRSGKGAAPPVSSPAQPPTAPPIAPPPIVSQPVAPPPLLSALISSPIRPAPPPLSSSSYTVAAPAVTPGQSTARPAMSPIAMSVVASDPAADAPGAPPRIGSLASLKEVGVISREVGPSPGVAPLSAMAASNAAADPWVIRGGAARASSTPPLHARVPLEMLWFDPAFVDAIRKDAAMRAIITENQKSKGSKRDEKKQPAARPSGPLDPQDREDITAVLSLGSPSGVDALETALADAVDERGMFHTPILLLEGDLAFPFDELETLKATIAAVAPLAVNDKKLKETIDTVGALLRTPWLQAAGSGTERLTAQIKEAFNASNRGLPQGFLETHTERILLENRHYQKRVLLGQTWIRALLGAPGTTTRVPTYIPHSLARELPMYQHLGVRAIAEVRAQIDQYETHPIALRVVALGRALDASPRR